MKLRIDKYLADMGIGSRTEIKNYIKKGFVSINDKVVTSPSEKADTETDKVELKGEEVIYLLYEYFLLNKPGGVVSASSDKKEKTVLDLITDKKRDDLFPVGRLDKDTEGLLLITNDGMLAHSLLSPKKHVDKTYYFETEGILTKDHEKMFLAGLKVDEDFTALPAILRVTDTTDIGSKGYITIREGKFHQIKRMMEAVGSRVTYLKRISMGPLILPKDLPLGDFRRLSREELQALKELE